MKHYKIKNVQFWIHNGHIHFCGTNDMRDFLSWPWPWCGKSKLAKINKNVLKFWDGVKSDVITKIKDEIGFEKITKISGFSFGCIVAMFVKNYLTLYNDNFKVYLDDPPRFFKNNCLYWTSWTRLTIFKKGRSIVHHLPFKWLGYDHQKGDVEIVELINYKCDACGKIEASGRKNSYLCSCEKIESRKFSDGSILFDRSGVMRAVKSRWYDIRALWRDHYKIKARY